MPFRRLVYASVLLGALLWLSACVAPGFTPTLNVRSIRTVLDDKGGGTNTFTLVVPKREAGCELPPLLPDQTARPFALSDYEDFDFKGFTLLYTFTDAEQIPQQIRLARHFALHPPFQPVPLPVPTSSAPTPKPMATSTPTPTPTPLPYDPNILSLDIKPPVTAFGVTQQEVTVVINPRLLTSAYRCRVPSVTYELRMSGNIETTQKAELFPEHSLKNVQVDRPWGGSVQWTIQAKSILDIAFAVATATAGLSESDIAELGKTAEGQTRLRDLLNRALDQEVARLKDAQGGQAKEFVRLAKARNTEQGEKELLSFLVVNSPVYTLTAKSTPADVVFQVLTGIVALVASLVTIVGGIMKISQARSKRQKGNEP